MIFGATHVPSWISLNALAPFLSSLYSIQFKGPNFLLDKTNSLFCNGYSLKIKDELVDKFPETEILQKILNSIVMHYYAKLTSFQISGNFECYQKNFIENFGIPNLNKNEINMIKKLNSERLDKYLCQIYSLDYNILKSYIIEHWLIFGIYLEEIHNILHNLTFDKIYSICRFQNQK